MCQHQDYQPAHVTDHVPHGSCDAHLQHRETAPDVDMSDIEDTAEGDESGARRFSDTAARLRSNVRVHGQDGQVGTGSCGGGR